MLISLIIACVVQALVAYALQQEGLVGMCAALLALKPLVDGFRIIFKIESEGAFNAEFNFAASRLVETSVESIPQTILPSLALASVEAADRARGQHISIGWSILNIAYSFVDVSVSLDKTHNFRAVEPLLRRGSSRNQRSTLG